MRTVKFILALLGLGLIAFAIWQNRPEGRDVREAARLTIRDFSPLQDVEALLAALHNHFVRSNLLSASPVEPQEIWTTDLSALSSAIGAFYPAGTGGYVSPTRAYTPGSFARVRGHWLNPQYLNLELSEGTRFDAFSGEAVPAGTRTGLEECDVKHRPPPGASSAEILTRALRCEYAQRLKSARLATRSQREAPTQVDAQSVVDALASYLTTVKDRGGIESFEVNLAEDVARVRLVGQTQDLRIPLFPYLVNPFATLEEEEALLLKRMQDAVAAGALIYSERERVLAPVALHRDRVMQALTEAAPLSTPELRRRRFQEVLSPSEVDLDGYVGVYPNGDFFFEPRGYETTPRSPERDGAYVKRVLDGSVPLPRSTENAASINLFCYPIPYGKECCDVLQQIGTTVGLATNTMSCTGDQFSESIPGGLLSIAPTVERDCRGSITLSGFGECLILMKMP